MIWKPVLLPPVFVHENRDGTLSWPGVIPGTFHVIRDLRDIPPAYLDPPRELVAELEQEGRR